MSRVVVRCDGAQARDDRRSRRDAGRCRCGCDPRGARGSAAARDRRRRGAPTARARHLSPRPTASTTVRTSPRARRRGATACSRCRRSAACAPTGPSAPSCWPTTSTRPMRRRAYDDAREPHGARLRPRLADAAARDLAERRATPLVDGGVYAQTRGPALRDAGRGPRPRARRRPRGDDGRVRVHPHQRGRARRTPRSASSTTSPTVSTPHAADDRGVPGRRRRRTATALRRRPRRGAPACWRRGADDASSSRDARARRRARRRCGAVDGVDRRARPRRRRRSPATRCSTAAGCALVPGLVNGHTHAAMTLFRGLRRRPPAHGVARDPRSGRPRRGSPPTTSTGARGSRASR